MDIKALDKALQEIAAKRNELSKLDYSNPAYDQMEEELHDMEDDFQEAYGDYMEKVLQEVHDRLCPDTDVLYPIAYIAKSYTVKGKNEFEVAPSEGVFVEMDQYPGKETKLAIIPSPTRVVLNIGKEKQEVVWTSK
ncbi:MAG: hypothetical protein OEU76_10015 [Cyclobacteriaceae bacterium]|nr:hypothetical protein [Cyclobacteriaceae bacterium]